MKKILVLLSLITVGFVSCQKEPIIDKKNYVTNIYESGNANPIGKTWELYSGRVFMTNLTDGTKKYYDHFDANKYVSNLDVFVASTLPIDVIKKGLTIWNFTNSYFMLDGNNTYKYNTNTHGIFSVYGLENGSARSIEVLKSTDDYMVVKLYESNGNDGVDNYSFYNTLTFVRSGSTTTPVEYNVPQGYSYGGIINGSSNPTNTLVGTKWVVTKYVQNFVTQIPNDTLEFISTNDYTINGSVSRKYNLSSIVGSNMKSLSLYSFTTLGGDWSGQVQGTFVSDWQFNNSLFTNILGGSPDTRLWATRIQ